MLNRLFTGASINKFESAPVKRGKLKCRTCQKSLNPKEGDWFVSSGSSAQQIFLCKDCEKVHKADYKKANLSRT